MNLNKLFTALRQRKNTPAHNLQAERRERYTHALEQFLDGQPAVRLGGVYTLVNLADEWLTDASFPEQVRREEAQTIIDTLTGCIRSPFPLAEKREVLEKDQVPDDYDGNFTADQAQLREEQDIRRTIFEEMSKRSSTLAESEKGEVTVTPGAWSGFKFDFSRALIFYPLNNLTIEQGNFASTRFYGEADFLGVEFTGNAGFRDAKFTGNAYFGGTYFEKYAPTFADAPSSARFSAQVDSQDYVFSVREGSKPIECGTATLDGNSFEIPLGAVLFDPDSWDEEEQYYTRFSKPAK